MSDIFLSYASEDRPWVLALVSTLERQGWSVWWDRTILPGKTFDQAIQEALDAAKCMIVGSAFLGDDVVVVIEQRHQTVG